uniref:Sidoreflexin n=1 Tax=Xenopsylla cheopis TaxID=163159 RepID=A0A6M2DF04_XENCH
MGSDKDSNVTTGLNNNNLEVKELKGPCLPRNINIDKPRYDQRFYWNRAKHFFGTTNPLNIFTTNRQLEHAREIVNKYRNGEKLPQTVTIEELWRAKTLYDSAYHPDTGDKMNIIGRMSAQVPMNMLITGGMMTFYKSPGAVIFWQWLNQSFNALVNYTNRSGSSEISNGQLLTSYVLATGGALTTALTLNKLVKRFPPVVGRFVPFVAVAASNCINVPMMRLQELRNGVPLQDEYGKGHGSSRIAAREGIAQVVFSRICMAAPGMLCVPLIMNHLELRGTLCRYPWANAPLQIGLVGLFLTFATPLCCALFQQRASISVNRLECELQEHLKSQDGCHIKCPINTLYYNKGL